MSSELELHLRSLTATVEDLEEYLLSKEVFWPRGDLPSLSLGGLFWDRTVLEAGKRELASSAAASRERLEREITDLQQRWRVAWEQKATAELRTRVSLWREYLRELVDAPDEALAYAVGARNRVMAAYLVEAAGNHAEVRSLGAALEALDLQLRSMFRRGEFVWEEHLQSAFPEDAYWYLYGNPTA